MKLIIFSKILVIPLLVCCSVAHVSAQKTQKIGDNPYTIDAQAVLELESTTKGFLLPRMSEAQMNLITTPTEGMMLYCTDCSTNADGELRIAYNSIWQTFKGDVTGDVTGNAATVSTNANLTGPITSTGNATSIGSQTGIGVTFAMSASPTFTGTPQAPTAKAGTDDTQIATTAFAKALTTAAGANFVDLTTNQTVAGTKTFSVDAKINSLNLGKGSGNKTTNTVFGLNALGTLNTGDYNTAIGYNAMQKNTSGNDNSAFGRLALAANQDGGTNSAFGTLALNKNSSGSYNVALGTQALRENTSGNENTAVGTNSLASNTSGKHNTAIGRVSLQANTTGEKNTGMGFQAGGNNQTGTSNSYLGYNSGLGITAGSNNTIIGANVTGLSSTLTSNIIIANGAGGTSAIKAQHDGTNWTLSGTTTASGFKTPTGTAAQFLKADGSVDSATYITSAGTATNVSGVVAIANGGTGSATQNFVDLTTAQSITGNKTFTGTVAGITPTMIGLENVDNTTDLLKPVSTATQTALDVKANLASPTFIGSPVAPTAAEGNNSTQIATTAFVSGAFETVISDGIAAQTLAIGDFIGGGVVFWVDPADNTKGLVSAVEDQSTGIQWHNGKSITTGATGTAVGTGASNTDAIIAAQGATETDYAAGLARAYNGGGFTDWFLPSKDELFQMALNKGDINTTAGANGGTNFSSGTYWSSSEASSSASRMVYWGNNHQQVYGKDGARGVRAVRAVGFPAISSLTAITAEQAAQNTAINLKAPIASPTFTGTPLALTAAAGTSTNQLATTAFVAAAASSSNFVDLTTNQSDIKGNKTFSNNLNITQNLTVTGISKSNGFHALGPKATTSQGGYLLWNLLKPGSSTFRDGFTSVVNHKGAGTGGFRFYNVSADITTADTPIVEIGSTGIIRAGAVTYTNLDGTNGQVLTTNGSGETSWSNPSAAIREVADEYSATASQTSFTLTQAPSVYSKVKMYVNGIRISNTAYSLSGSTLTYNPANNGGNSLTTGDRIQMDYYY